MELNHRCLVVGQESLPLDHGTVSGSLRSQIESELSFLRRAQAEAVGLEPQSLRPSSDRSSSGRMTSVELRELESNQHHDVQSVASYR